MMTRRQLPDYTHPDVYSDAPTGFQWTAPGLLLPDDPCNFATHFASSEMSCPEHKGLLSLKSALNGQEVYETGEGVFAVDDSAYLILNEGHSYSCAIQSETTVESFCVFFDSDMRENVLHGLTTPDAKLLDQLRPDKSQPVEFFEQLYPHDQIVSPRLRHLRETLSQEWTTYGWREEQFHLLLQSLMYAHRNVAREIDKIPAARHSTRVELYRRLHRARDFMEANLHRPITLIQIAEEAWFSPHHFLRLFKQVFQETPHQYLTRRRMERARTLLEQTDMPVTEICFAVGFESLGSFSWLFRRRVGVSPEKHRQNSHRRVYSAAG